MVLHIFKMEEYLKYTENLPIAASAVCILMTAYAFIFMNNATVSRESEDRIINTLSSIISGEMNSIHNNIHENPYDLFTHIYPSIREMKNAQINELIDLLENYNAMWLDNDE